MSSWSFPCCGLQVVHRTYFTRNVVNPIRVVELKNLDKTVWILLWAKKIARKSYSFFQKRYWTNTTHWIHLFSVIKMKHLARLIILHTCRHSKKEDFFQEGTFIPALGHHLKIILTTMKTTNTFVFNITYI